MRGHMMDSYIQDLEFQGWKIQAAAHGSNCTGCQIQALNAAGVAHLGGGHSGVVTFPESATGSQHRATITRKDA